MSFLFSSSLHLLPPSNPATSFRHNLPPRIAAVPSSPLAGGIFSVAATSLSHYPDGHSRCGPLYCSSSASMSVEESTSASQLEDSLLYARAFWVSRYVIAWNVEVGSGSCYLFGSKMATLRVKDGVVEGYDVKIKLEKDRGPLPENVIKKFPHIQNYCPFTVPLGSAVEPLLKCQLAVATFNSYGQCNNITCLQLPGVLDDLFSYEGPLGAVYSKEAVSLYLWAPTAQAVQAQIYKEPVGGRPFEVIHRLSSDGGRTLFVDLGSDDLKPEGWDKLADEKPPLHSFSDISIPNDHDHGTDKDAEFTLAMSKDHIQVAMAANLRDYVLTNFEGKEVKGSELRTYDGSSVAYASCPTETVNYVSAHDNETLFDVVSLKTPRNITVNDRCRMNHLATSIIALSQGIPFFHCGDELLRSKSMDRDSYNSGDWFNRLDFTYMTNNWGVGLPPKEKNEYNWPLIKPRLADPSFKPSKSHILAAVENFTNLLQIRYSSPLFRLKTANAIQKRVRFHNTGTSLIPGVIVMSIEDGQEGIPGLTQLDPIYSYIVVVVNARPSEISFPCPVLRARTLQLHPIQLMSTDPMVKNSAYEPSTGCFMVPSRTTSVFVELR
ncbi:pullulanase 1, chloroplastic-like [Cucurbita maxima]|uniref:Pullulanase 1, chloroplastic-like n=1 Tax=Cucurbita maxima TaxID=3661 RepID=A0A6J1HTH9_CUCMA|nr:pullulanase 1, chloroplastic-like [Cucurbita maxima]